MLNTPTIISDYLSRYLRSVEFTDKYLPAARLALKREWKSVQEEYRDPKQEEYRDPKLEYLSERNKDFIRQQFKRLQHTPTHGMVDTLEINSIVLIELYTTVSNVKGDREWLLQEFRKQYRFVYTAIKYGPIRS